MYRNSPAVSTSCEIANATDFDGQGVAAIALCRVVGHLAPAGLAIALAEQIRGCLGPERPHISCQYVRQLAQLLHDIMDEMLLPVIKLSGNQVLELHVNIES